MEYSARNPVFNEMQISLLVERCIWLQFILLKHLETKSNQRFTPEGFVKCNQDATSYFLLLWFALNQIILIPSIILDIETNIAKRNQMRTRQS